MKVFNIRHYKKSDKLGVIATLKLDSGKSHEVFFETDYKDRKDITLDANPFVAASLGIAMKKNEHLYIDGRVSGKLFNSIPNIQRIISSWNRGFSLTKVEVKNISKSTAKSNKVGTFFSAGADSFYTYIKNKKKINKLIFVHGFDISLSRPALYKKVKKSITKVAKEEKIDVLCVRTNVREVFEQYFDWDLSHEFALACVALFLEKGYKEIFASCGLPFKGSEHYFMTPEIDVLWSSEIMKINHFGCSAGKEEKLKFFSKSKLVMNNLRVCWQNSNGEFNCSECEKCLRNMLVLNLYGSLSRCKTFNKKIDVQVLRNKIIDGWNLNYFKAILKSYRRKGNDSPVRYALEDLVSNNLNPTITRKLSLSIRTKVRYIDNKYNRNRAYWFLASRGLV